MGPIPGLPDPTLARHRVLLIDDQRLIGETVRKMLADQADMAYEFCHDPAAAAGLIAVPPPAPAPRSNRDPSAPWPRARPPQTGCW